jgi:hypothetical protein
LVIALILFRISSKGLEVITIIWVLQKSNRRNRVKQDILGLIESIGTDSWHLP